MRPLPCICWKRRCVSAIRTRWSAYKRSLRPGVGGLRADSRSPEGTHGSRIRRIEAALVPDAGKVGLTKKTLESYMKSSICIVCREGLDSDSPLCQSCFDQAPQTILYLRSKLARSERKATQFATVCRSCSGLGWNEPIKCDSKDCPVFYSRIRHKADHGSAVAQIAPVLNTLEQQEGQGLDW